MTEKTKIEVSIIGGSGYAGGELLRLLLLHPRTKIKQVTSIHHKGKPVETIHPNLRGFTDLRFCGEEDLKPTDVLILALPHGEAARKIGYYLNLAPRIVDLSADFRLKKAEEYEKWYNFKHPNPEFLKQFVYGLAELHREEIKEARYVSIPGCNAVAVILALFPFYKENLINENLTVAEVKAGTSEGGRQPKASSHHPERVHSIRAYALTAHRHIAEIKQELQIPERVSFNFSAISIDMVRGVQAVCHAFLKERLEEKHLRKLFCDYYRNSPFIRIFSFKRNHYRYPDPKLLWGTNFCDIGFEVDPFSNRIVVVSAIDNLVKGAAGSAVQAINLMFGFDETEGLLFPGLHPI